MSTASLPSYHYHPQQEEQRLLGRSRIRTRPVGNFVKNSKNGGVVLKLSGQHDDVTIPEYGRGASVDGTVELVNVKLDGIQSIEVTIEGALKLKEVAEGGTHTSSLCLDVKTLWNKDMSRGECPTTLPFSLTLPATFWDGKASYPLPPSFEAHLSGLPGFRANIEYSVSAVVTRSKLSLFGLTNISVETPILYRPRSRPAEPLPAPLPNSMIHPSHIVSDDWTAFNGLMRSRSSRNADIVAHLFIPSSRVFSVADPIPYKLYVSSTVTSLAMFLPYAPSPLSPSSPLFSSSPSSSTPVTRIQLLRQTVVDVRSIQKGSNRPMTGHQTDIWKTVQIGEGGFRHEEEGREWTCWSGEVVIDPAVTVGGFKASGLTLKDFLVLSIMPPELTKAPFTELRLSIPIKLTTDPWSFDGADDYYVGSDYSDPVVNGSGNANGNGNAGEDRRESYGGPPSE